MVSTTNSIYSRRFKQWENAIVAGSDHKEVNPTFSPIGLGTGGAEYLQGDNCIDIVAGALDHGYRHIDTAQSYGNEVEVGKGIAQSSVPREDILLATKIHKQNLAYDDVHRTARESRDRLNVDTIDLLYVHFPTQTYDPHETLRAFDELVDDGVITHIGVSNFAPEEVDEAKRILTHPVVVNQVEMHPLYQQSNLVEYAQSTDLPIVAYSPLAQGKVFSIPELTQIAEARGISEAAVALAWLTGKSGVSAIPKTTSLEHLKENFQTPNIALTPDEIATIESIEHTEKLIEIA